MRGRALNTIPRGRNKSAVYMSYLLGKIFHLAFAIPGISFNLDDGFLTIGV